MVAEAFIISPSIRICYPIDVQIYFRDTHTNEFSYLLTDSETGLDVRLASREWFKQRNVNWKIVIPSSTRIIQIKRVLFLLWIYFGGKVSERNEFQLFTIRSTGKYIEWNMYGKFKIFWKIGVQITFNQ